MAKRRSFSIPRVWQYVGVGVLSVVTLGLIVQAFQPDVPPVSAETRPALSAEDFATEAPASVEQNLDGIRTLVASGDPLVVSVLGDSTGNGASEWVGLWAEHLAANATVTVHYWDEATGAYSAPVVYGTGARPIEIWNGSMAGRTATDGLASFAALQPIAPGLVILNYGHNQAAEPIGSTYRQLVAASGDVPVFAMIQNPAQAERAALTAGSQAAVRAWAEQYAVPAVDVDAAFVLNPNWAVDYMADLVHPNDAGERVWADAVIAALG